jgi:2-oxo-3-hexenedioate decarboxylase
MDLEAIANELIVARRTRSFIEPPSSRNPAFSVEVGYAVGALLHAESLRCGCTAVGLKLGFTNQTVWSEYGLDSPFCAPMYAETVTDRREVSLGAFVGPRIEPEIVVGVGADLHRGASSHEVSAAISWAAVGFEVVQCHYPGWEMTPADAIADAGLHGVLVIGQRVDLGPSDAPRLAEVHVEVVHENTVVAHGVGANALGGPVEALTWLLQLPGVDTLSAGAVVTTGTLTSAFPLVPGERWRTATTGPVPLGDLPLALES